MGLLFKTIKEEDTYMGINSLVNDSTPLPSFFFLTNMSAVIATLGLLMNNVSVIIGSMLVAPLLSPILALTLGFNIRDGKLIKRSFKTLTKASIYAIIVSLFTTILFSYFAEGVTLFGDKFNTEILSRTEFNLLFLLVAIAAGATTAFARMKPELNDSLPGTAIAIALVPPLATIGIMLGATHWVFAFRAFLLFLLNAVGIMFGAYFIFHEMGIHQKKKVAERAVEKADTKLEKMKEEHEEEQIENTIEKLSEDLGIQKTKKKQREDEENKMEKNE